MKSSRSVGIIADRLLFLGFRNKGFFQKVGFLGVILYSNIMARVIDRLKNPLLRGVPEGRGGLDLRYLLTRDRLQLH
jgi:hypothetical protein